ncbi:alpha-(1,3)-fucosyltransferase 7-like [Argopecten irradians]|uniref:alpha-(1,3)-fucosyltransferase 7-like n=1 Tax=Argopecten irradians TaxID=31199 RepID=UPI003715CD70
MVRWRTVRLKYVTVVWAIGAVCLSVKLLHETYETTRRKQNDVPWHKQRDVVEDSESKWSIFRRHNDTMDIYLEKLKHVGEVELSNAQQKLHGVVNDRISRIKETETFNGRRVIKVHYFNKPEHVSENSFSDCPDACSLTWGVNADISKSDAVIFQGPNLALTNPSPPSKPRGQIWILHGSEAPVYWMRDLSQWHSVFNWTMAYRRDADVRHSYGEFRKRQSTRSSVATTKSVRPIGWFVSHCTTSSLREVYVKQLSKHVNVDIYGACGKLNCPYGKYKECIDRYRFYLSFENAICRDYITEKVFSVYQIAANTIPVVRGFKEQASIFLPPGSYVSTDDFTSHSELSKFIENISSNETLFTSYFRWKQFYESYSYEPNPFCVLCRKLHHSDSYRRLYNDIDAWLKGGNRPFCGSTSDVT